MKKKKILLADDHCMLREGLRSLIENQPKFEVVAEAENGRMAVQLARRFSPDVVVMDVSMPVLNGIDATRQVLAEVPGTRVVGLSVHADSSFVLGMLNAGASGYVLKECAFQELLFAVEAALSDQTFLSPRVAGIVVKDWKRRYSVKNGSVYDALTGREREVLQLIAEGRSTRDIAKALHISVKTVEARRRAIMDKLNLHSVAALVKYAIREGLSTTVS